MLRYAVSALIAHVVSASADDTFRSDHVSNITGTEFTSLIEGAQDYMPIVFFHVDWCQHCKQTMPEFHRAAEELQKHAHGMTKARGYIAQPKFFTFDCSGNDIEQTQFCDEYVGTRFPGIVAVRPSGKKMFFNRPRVKDVIRWWAARVSSTSVLPVAAKDLEQAKSHYSGNNVFIYVYNEESKKTTNSAGERLIDVYTDAAESLMDGDYLFLVNDPDSTTSYLKDNSDNFYIGLLPNQYNKVDSSKYYAHYDWTWGADEFSATRVLDWASVAKQPACGINLNLDELWDMTQSERPAVIVAHVSMSEEELADQFCDKATVTENRGKYFFGSIRVDTNEILDVMRKHYMLVRYWPHVFVTNHQGKELRYWEDKSQLDLDGELFSLEAIEGIMDDDMALNYYGANPFESMKSTFVTRSKFAFRFAQEGVGQFFVTVTLLSMVGYLLFQCLLGLIPSRGEKAEEGEQDKKTVEDKNEGKKETKKSK